MNPSMSLPSPTCATPTTSAMRLMPSAIAWISLNEPELGHTPITPPVPAITRAWSGVMSRLRDEGCVANAECDNTSGLVDVLAARFTSS